MSKEFVYRNQLDWPNARLKVAAIVGHTTDTLCRLWLRTGKLGDFTLIYYPIGAGGASADFFDGFKRVPYNIDALPASVNREPHKVENFDRDTTDVLDLKDLSPGTEYCYALCGRDEGSGEWRIILGHDRRHTFRTMPAAAEDYSFAFYSCHMPFDEDIFGNVDHSKKKVMWQYFGETLSRHYQKGLSFVIAGGDQVYVDGIRNEKINIIERLNKEARRKGGALLPSREEMVLWYRDIYRGYWGMEEVKSIMSSYPTYMIWDDHELWDGWGSYLLKKGSKDDELDRMFPIIKKAGEMNRRGLSRADLLELKKRMFEAAKKVYTEYQHSHNPEPRPKGAFDYNFDVGPGSAFYVLDGRGQRDVNRETNDKILGAAQLKRFRSWVSDNRDKKFLFVVSAVPVIHVRTVVANLSKYKPLTWAGLQDDLRDSWENDMHTEERNSLMEILFEAADRGQRVAILSGDVHIAAAFKIANNNNSVIYQLTSSAITYNIPLWESHLFALFGVPDDGEIKDVVIDRDTNKKKVVKYRFKRLALYGGSNYSLVRVATSGGREEAEFQLYGGRSVLAPKDLPEGARGSGLLEKLKGHVAGNSAVTHSIAKIPLDFKPF